MTGIDIQGLKLRALFLRVTQPVSGVRECRVFPGGADAELAVEDRQPGLRTVLQLAWRTHHKEPLVPGAEPRPTCGTDGCLVHLDLDEEAKVTQLATRRPLDMRSIFRRGLAAGVFRAVGNYR